MLACTNPLKLILWANERRQEGKEQGFKFLNCSRQETRDVALDCSVGYCSSNYSINERDLARIKEILIIN